MRVPARIFADAELLEAIVGDQSLEQLQNVATLPGIVEAALAMPDIHQGYGFPVGGVAAMELPDGVVSPGGVGYDINCGVRLLALPLSAAELGERREPLVHEISRVDPGRQPASTDRSGSPDSELNVVLARRARARSSHRGIGREDDLERTESQGCLPGADPAAVSARAHERGAAQLGTAGAGNHFIELQRVDHVFDPDAAEAFGLAEGRLTVLIHSGSRGLGHQVCTDYVRVMDAVRARYGIELPDRQLACAPASSPEGRAYLAAMAAAANFAFANRHAMAHAVRGAIARVLGTATRRGDPPGVRRRPQRGQGRAPRRARGARPPQGRNARLPGRVDGDPGRLTAPSASRSSSRAAWAPRASCSPASRARWSAPSAPPATAPAERMSRTRARKQIGGGELRRQLEAQGIVVRCPSNKGLAEEAPFAYKDVERVVEVVERAGLARRVARLVPIGVVKG